MNEFKKLFAGHLHRHSRLAEGVSCGKGVILGGGVTLDGKARVAPQHRVVFVSCTGPSPPCISMQLVAKCATFGFMDKQSSN